MVIPYFPRRRRHALAAITIAATLAVTPAATAATGNPRKPAPPTRPTGHTITLLTGDKVRVSELDGGRITASVTRAPGATGGVLTRTVGKDLYVIPDEALPLLSAGRLDRRLFDVTGLIRQGYDDARTPRLPLIVSYAGAAARSALPPGARTVRSLRSIGGAAVEADKRQVRALWSSLAANRTRDLGGGIGKVWLDGKVGANLADSVAQIGAPAAWRSGYDGKGVKVAVLDTGVDRTHPDLKDRVGEVVSFVPGDDGGDRNGHGTHVASTVAGTGAASAGKEKGVAPGATVLTGKVLDDEGFGQASWVIAGMEWAAGRKAAVVSMSLGDPDYNDGQDPLSQALNKLSNDSGALFAVAAGNEYDPGTVGSPGAADAALTVAAVDGGDRRADFSSQGPRGGDFALKPDIAAPGVDILAARSQASPGAGPYTTLSGTSMATPHVAGAAAVLAQRHPDWSAAQLKDALMSTAKGLSGTTAYQVGTGRLDVASAVTGNVHATGSAYLGFYDWPHGSDPAAKRTVSYTNSGDQPVTLNLTTTGDKAFALSAPTLTVPARGTAAVAVTADLKRAGTGTHLGQILAAGPGGTVLSRTSLGLTKEDERYNLKVRVIGRDGKPASGTLELMQQGKKPDPYGSRIEGEGTLRLPPAVYSAMMWLRLGDRDDPKGIVLLGDPQLDLRRSTTLVLDARRATEIKAITPQPSQTTQGHVDYYRRFGKDSAVNSRYMTGSPAPRLYAAPTKRVTKGSFEFLTRWRRVSPPQSRGSYVYDLVDVHRGRIPDALVYRPRARDLARLDVRYRGHRSADGGGYRYDLRPYTYGAIGYLERESYPAERTEWVSTPRGTTYHDTHFIGNEEMEQRSGLDTYRPGSRQRIDWFAPVQRPRLGHGAWQPTREPGYLSINITPWTDSGHDHAGFMDWKIGKLDERLYQGGKLIGTSTTGGISAEVPQQRLPYRLTLDATRPADPWRLSTRTHTEWNFTSGNMDTGAELALLQLDYAIDTDVAGNAPAGRRQRIGLRGGFMPGVKGAGKVKTATLEVSYDNGTTWTKVPLTGGNGAWQATLNHPATKGGFVSLRATARDSVGNAVRQEVIRAYGLR